MTIWRVYYDNDVKCDIWNLTKVRWYEALTLTKNGIKYFAFPFYWRGRRNFTGDSRVQWEEINRQTSPSLSASETVHHHCTLWEISIPVQSVRWLRARAMNLRQIWLGAIRGTNTCIQTIPVKRNWSIYWTLWFLWKVIIMDGVL